MKKFMLVITLLFTVYILVGQSPVGRWKIISRSIENADGTKKDMTGAMKLAVPCMADIKYIFSADGKMSADANGCPAALKKTVEETNSLTRWMISGSSLTVADTKNTMPPSTYKITFSGKTMIWKLLYKDNPKINNDTNAKSLTIVYEKL